MLIKIDIKTFCKINEYNIILCSALNLSKIWSLHILYCFIIYYKVISFKVLYVITYYNRMSPTKLDHYFYKIKFHTDGTL